MRLSNHECLFARSLRHSRRHQTRTRCSIRNSCLDAQRRRNFSSSPSSNKEEKQDVAILGGGISGLASAYYISKADPEARITVYEASERLGGWVSSKIIRDTNGEKAMVFERGPRTLRTGTNGFVTATLIEELGLKNDCIFVPKDDPSSINRYIYDGRRLLRMPTPKHGLFDIAKDLWLASRILPPIVKGMLHELRYNGPEPDNDESIGSFLTRRFNASVADLASAMIHGIYAGDVDQLSIRSLFPKMAFWARRPIGVVGGMTQSESSSYHPRHLISAHDHQLRLQDDDFFARWGSSSVLTLKDGLGSLIDALERKLEQNPNVRIRKGSRVASINRLDESTDKVSLTICRTSGARNAEQVRREFSTVISTLPHHALCSMYPQDISGSIAANKLPTVPTVTVMVVNLYFAKTLAINNEGAFGYLIPRSVPFSTNPECALGVVFDSYAAPGQDSSLGAKMTVMLGGHWWDGFKQLPTEEDGIEMARSVVKRHLGMEEKPVLAFATLQRDCIPQFTVGHHMRMRDVHNRILKDFKGRLKVIGASYNGVGVNDCTRAAWDLGMRVETEGCSEPWTGLERYERPALDVVRLTKSDDGTLQMKEV